MDFPSKCKKDIVSYFTDTSLVQCDVQRNESLFIQELFGESLPPINVIELFSACTQS